MLRSRLLAAAIGLVLATAAVVPTLDLLLTAPPAPALAAHIAAQPVRPAAATVSADTLLAKLPVRAGSHAGSYGRSRFRLWIDADHDCESTRAEVLKAESRIRVTENAHCTVLTGRWVSPYDGKVVTKARLLDIDHRVPLEEAWVSGAWAWSAAKREAFANDLGYGPSLVAVSEHANRAKGDRDPAHWLPSRRSDRCAYVRDWVAVKYRWHLSVDRVEKAAITAVLRGCASQAVRRPGTPDVGALDGD